MDLAAIHRFRLHRHRLAGERREISLVDAARCPASNFARGAALLALAARTDSLTKQKYDDEVDSGALVLAPVMRAAIHIFDPAAFAVLGRSLIGVDDDELRSQLGEQMRRIFDQTGIAPSDALGEVAEATRDALSRGRRLDRNDLYEELRGRVRDELMPWCKGCESNHVAPMLWRFAGVAVGVRRDSKARYLIGLPKPKSRPSPDPADAARIFLRFYAPATLSAFGIWAGTPSPQAKRIWDGVADELERIRWDGGTGYALAADVEELSGASAVEGMRLLPPGDPFLAYPDRKVVIADEALRKRAFRPVASPGVVLVDGRIAGLWRVKAKGKRSLFRVEEVRRVPRRRFGEEAERIAALRGSEGAEVTWE